MSAVRPLALFVTLVLAVVLTGCSSSGSAPAPSSSSSGAVPITWSTADGIAIGPPAKATLDVYLDARCDFCVGFVGSFDIDLTNLVHTGQLQLRWHPLAALDPPGTSYSLRAANALACAATEGSATEFSFFLETIFGTSSTSHQLVNPGRTGAGPSDGQLLDYASGAGVQTTATLTDCVHQRKWAGAIRAATSAAKGRFDGTHPGLVLNGAPVPYTETEAELLARIKAAAG